MTLFSWTMFTANLAVYALLAGLAPWLFFAMVASLDGQAVWTTWES